MLQSLLSEVSGNVPIQVSGRVNAVRGPIVWASLPQAALGDVCEIETRTGSILAQVVAFDRSLTALAPYSETDGLFSGALVTGRGESLGIPISPDILGSVIDPLGHPLYQSPKNSDRPGLAVNKLALYRNPPPCLDRSPITAQLLTGISTIDGLCPLGHGQRLGIFASAGLGKSTLLAQIVRQASVDVSILALVGERGREVGEFVHDTLGPEGIKRSVVVASTSDESAFRRSLAVYTATSIAEYFRDQGKKALLVIDSITRVARSIRDISLAAGELPVRQGYTASVYAALPRIIERAGNNATGSITALYTVLTNTSDDIDPLADEIKSLLDGHLVLSSELAAKGIHPAIDPVQSISRLRGKLQSPEDQECSRDFIRLWDRLVRDKPLLILGGEADPELKALMAIEQQFVDFFAQGTAEQRELAATQERKRSILGAFHRARPT